MSWSSNHVPKYRKHRASGQAIVTIRGRDHYPGPHGTKVRKVEYDRLIAEFLANGRQPLHTSPSEITVVELCARYIDYAKRYYRKKNGALTTSGSVVARRFVKTQRMHEPESTGAMTSQEFNTRTAIRWLATATRYSGCARG